MVAGKFFIILSVFMLSVFGETGLQGQRTGRVRYERAVEFSGYRWMIKSSAGRTGPGPNFFSASNVHIDRRGRLHLYLSREKNRWYCAEVVSSGSFGYGRYEFLIGSSPPDLDINAVLGLFTWDPDLKPHHNEIDIEFSRWGGKNDHNSQYVVHYGENDLEKYEFSMKGSVSRSLHVIDWMPGKLVFESYRGSRPWSWRKIESITITGNKVPAPANEQVRLNLWLAGGRHPENDSQKATSARIDRFTFTPYGCGKPGNGGN